MNRSINLILTALLLNTVLADVRDNGPQTLLAPAPQYAQRYKEVIMYLTPTQIRDYEAGHGLPHSPPENPSYHNYEQQKPEPEIPLNDEEGRIIQSTLDILEANKMQLQQQHNNPNIEITRAQESQSEDFKPIVEPNVEEQSTRLYPVETQKPRQNKYEEQSSKDQENVAKSYAYLHFFSNKRPESLEKIQIFHPEPHNVNLDEEIRLQKEKNIEIQQDPLLRQKFKLIPYEFIADQEIHERERVKEQQSKPEKQAPLQFFVPEPSPQPANKDKPIPKNENIHEYAPQFTSLNNNIDLEKIMKEIQLEREAYKIHAENIAKSPPIVIHKDIKIIRRRPVPVTNHVNLPYPAPFFVPVEVKVPHPYAVPIEIVRHVPLPIVRTETVEVEKPVPYEVEKRVPEIVEKKVYVPVEKPYTVERFIPVEVKKEIPIEIPVHRPEKFTIIRHTWKH
ncbi:hypothetical protein MSG28_004618 [Choristoneura fumiferana]|uniref:Uncharacterized protein n=1 Tax=Choristoneura fumiferana TaxID=7141 RepID=A0ACC0K798_CHOFU|nr:hypothetical protein MSG28_004618 [Choristoneura fumiferana]